MSFLGMVNNDGADRPVASTLFGSCVSLSSEASKYVTLPDFDALLSGMTVHVLFRYSNAAVGTSESPITLNVNGTGAKPIYTDATNFPGTTPMTSWQANSVVSFTYDGEAWRMNDVGLSSASQKSALADMIYPIGSIYMSVSSTNPGTLFGGSWEQLQDTFLLAAGSSHAAGSTGGAESRTIEVGNLPSHSHQVGAHSHTMAHTHTGPSHSHGLNGHTHSIPALSGTAASNGAHTHNLSSNVMAPSSSYGNSASAGTGFMSTAVTATSNGAHTHTVSTVANTTGGNSGNTAAAGTGNTGGSSAANTGEKAAFNTGATGSGTALNTMPPYLAVYVWKRVA